MYVQDNTQFYCLDFIAAGLVKMGVAQHTKMGVAGGGAMIIQGVVFSKRSSLSSPQQFIIR